MSNVTSKRSKVGATALALFVFAGNMTAVGKGNLFELCAATVAGAFALAVAAYAATFVFGREGKKGFFFILLSLVTVASAIFVAAETVSELAFFVGEAVLPRLPWLLAGALLIALSSYLASKGAVAVKKFSLIAFVWVSMSVLLLFLLSLRSFKSDGATELLSSAREFTVRGSADAFAKIFAPAVIAVIYISASRDGGGAVGSALGGALLAVCFLNVLLLLGSDVGETEAYPYATAVSTVTSGKIFARMEGFVYLICCAAATVRVSVCLSLVSVLAEKVIGKRLSFIPYASGIVLLLVTAATVAA